MKVALHWYRYWQHEQFGFNEIRSATRNRSLDILGHLSSAVAVDRDRCTARQRYAVCRRDRFCIRWRAGCTIARYSGGGLQSPTLAQDHFGFHSQFGRMRLDWILLVDGR